MNKHFLKNIRDNIPEPLKYLTAPIFRNKLIRNTEYCRYREILYERELLSTEAIINYQFNELKKILIYSNNYVPYYTKLFKNVGFDPMLMKSMNEMSRIPFLTKDLIRSNFDELISTRKVPGGHYIATTGGSSGEPLKVLLDYNTIFKTMAFVYHYRKTIGYNESQRLATFRGVKFDDGLWKYNPMYNELIFSPFKLSSITLVYYLKKINKYRPDYLNGYLSSLYYFAKLLSENNLKLDFQPKGIFLISENINKDQRLFIENFFQAKSATFYGHSECCILGEEVMPNEYMFDPYYGYTELLNLNDRTYEIVGTGFLNQTMPLIRYKTNDLGKITDNKTISITGRWEVNDYLLGFNGERISHAAFNFHSEIFKDVVRYQFVQTQKGKTDLLLIVNRTFNTDKIELIKNEIEKKTKGVVEFNIKITDQLILSKRGKFKIFINNINN